MRGRRQRRCEWHSTIQKPQGPPMGPFIRARARLIECGFGMAAKHGDTCLSGSDQVAFALLIAW